MTQLANQIAVVTGAGRGIGRAIALKFAAAGADVACLSRTAENAEKVAAEVRALGRRAWAHAVDVADGAAVAAVAPQVLAEAGRVDILVNNAGVARDGLILRMSEADWDAVLDTNLKGAWLVSREASARWVAAKRAGKILIATAGTNVGVIDRLKKGEIHMVADQQNVMQGRMAVNVMVAALNGEPVPELITPPIREVTTENLGSIDWSVSLPPAGWKP